MKIRVGDIVQVITGTNKGKEGKVLKVLRKDNRVLVDGINIVKKNVKPINGKESKKETKKEVKKEVTEKASKKNTKKESK